MNFFTSNIIPNIAAGPDCQRVVSSIMKGVNHQSISGLSGSSRSCYIAALFHALNKFKAGPALIVTHDLHQMHQIADDLHNFINEETEIIFYTSGVDSLARAERIETLSRLVGGFEGFVIAPAAALSQQVAAPDEFQQRQLNLKIGSKYPDLLESLVNLEYERVDVVEKIGQFSVRGGIIDIYSPGCDDALRLDFFDDELESLRFFDLENQKSHSPIEQAVLLPAAELLANATQTDMFSYCRDASVIICDEWLRISEETPDSEKSILDQITKSDIPKLYFASFSQQLPGVKVQQKYNIPAKSIQRFQGHMHLLQSEFKRWQTLGFRMILTCNKSRRLSRLERIMSDYDIPARLIEDASLEIQAGVLNMAVSDLLTGLELEQEKLVIVTEQDIFNLAKTKPVSVRHKKGDHGARIRSYQDLKKGDYVVHVNSGIGKYLGIVTLEVNGFHRDYLHIQYAKNDKLYVPVDQIDLIQKYIGGEEGAAPRVSSLGGGDWARTKRKAKQAIEDMAEELIELYAKRQQRPGFAFAPDTVYQQEFEAGFPYEETPDQLRSIQEVKYSMEQSIAMDRLLCGDVGYGKTEVAMRAAFKAIMNDKQVAILVPTTILAEQHYETFKNRFRDYPIQIEVLSRFRSSKEQKAVLEKLKTGEVDIIIGTHRLLSKDVVFKELGFLVVDEEQRFGVKHKERIKQLKTNIDVLTLSATPIPRTLHMSMVGVRDLSIIETPPRNRFPVQTYVEEYSEALVQEAIKKELARGGQVYFLYNQTQNIELMAGKISRLVPEASVAIAHGQMPERSLHKVMIDFLEGDLDVLVSTTIIETGMDISNVNTLIIYDADKLGLSQLYQLRGRVGRSNRVAYAYFTYKQNKSLSEVAQKRLQAVQDFTDLGSGFKIAMRDLSIRGAGNLLGSQQHGHVASVGFDLYTEMLQEAVARLQGKEVEPPPRNINIALNVDAYLPSQYIHDEGARVEIYKRIKLSSSLDQLHGLESELRDRYGAVPSPVNQLLAVARVRIGGIAKSIILIEEREGNILIEFAPDSDLNISADTVTRLNKSLDHKFKFLNNKKAIILLDVQKKSICDKLDILEKFVSLI